MRVLRQAAINEETIKLSTMMSNPLNRWGVQLVVVVAAYFIARGLLPSIEGLTGTHLYGDSSWSSSPLRFHIMSVSISVLVLIRLSARWTEARISAARLAIAQRELLNADGWKDVEGGER